MGCGLVHFLQVELTALAFYKKLLAAHNYKPTTKVNSPVTLIKPTENYAKLSADYGLSEVMLKKMSVSPRIYFN